MRPGSTCCVLEECLKAHWLTFPPRESGLLFPRETRAEHIYMKVRVACEYLLIHPRTPF